MKLLKRLLAFVLVGFLAISSGVALAAHGGGGGHGGGFHGGAPVHGSGGYHGGGGYHHGGGGFHGGVGVYFGGLGFYPWGYPWPYGYYGAYGPYYGPYYPFYYAPDYAPYGPSSYVEQGTPQAAPASPPVWHYCANPNGYYPYVKQCPGGWQQVPAVPPAGS